MWISGCLVGMASRRDSLRDHRDGTPLPQSPVSLSIAKHARPGKAFYELALINASINTSLKKTVDRGCFIDAPVNLLAYAYDAFVEETTPDRVLLPPQPTRLRRSWPLPTARSGHRPLPQVRRHRRLCALPGSGSGVGRGDRSAHHGTLSGKHGIGLAKKNYLPMAMNDASRAFMTRVKRSIGPNGILTPGKFV